MTKFKFDIPLMSLKSTVLSLVKCFFAGEKTVAVE